MKKSNLLKGAVHVHSDFEEGDLSLKKIKDIHVEKEYNFVFLTEHNRIRNQDEHKKLLKKISKLNDNSFIFIPGLEIECKEGHILLLNQQSHIKGNSHIKKIIKKKDKKALAILAHPQKSQYNLLNQYNLDGVEVWNAKNDGFVPNLSLLNYLKRAAKKRKELKKLILIGGPDAHQKTNFFKVDIVLKGDIKKSEIIKNIKKNNFKIKRRKICFDNNNNFSFGISKYLCYYYIVFYNKLINSAGSLFRFLNIEPKKYIQHLAEKFK